MNFRFPQCVSSDLSQIIPQASRDAIQLMNDFMNWNPKKRPSTGQALKYPYFGTGANLGATTTQAEAMKKLHSEKAFGTHSQTKMTKQENQKEISAKISSNSEVQQKKNFTPPSKISSNSMQNMENSRPEYK